MTQELWLRRDPCSFPSPNVSLIGSSTFLLYQNYIFNGKYHGFVLTFYRLPDLREFTQSSEENTASSASSGYDYAEERKNETYSYANP